MFEKFGLKNNPYTTVPITNNTLNLFVGRKQEISRCSTLLGSKSIIVIEGGRGVGTTSFGNYVRFTQRKKRKNFTPESELSVISGWNEEMLIINVLSSLVGSLEEVKKIKKYPKFLDIKHATHEMREIYKTIGLQLISVGAQYGKQAVVTIPPRYPVTTLIQDLQHLEKIVKNIGYDRDIVIQINNLDINTTISSTQLKIFLNRIRDLLQLPGYSWLLVGDTGLRGFIASNVDRLDDIVTFEVYIPPLSLEEVYEAINRRLERLKIKENVEPPLTNDLIEALYNASGGRIRQIFGTATRLLSLIADNPLIDKINLKDAVPLLKTMIGERISQYGIDKSPVTYNILQKLAEFAPITPTQLSKKISISRPQISRALALLQKARLVYVQQKGKERLWMPMADVKIAMTKGALSNI